MMISDYSSLAPDAQLGPSDLVSLLLHEGLYASESLARLPIDLCEYYRTAASALCRALSISYEEARTRILDASPDSSLESMYFCQLLHVREEIVHAHCVLSEPPEGDAFGRDSEFAPAPIRAARAIVADWCQASSGRMLDGLALIDHAICLQIGWDPRARVSYQVLRAEYEFPDPSKYAFQP